MGIVLNWILTNYELKPQEHKIINIITQYSLNKYHKRKVAIKQSEFNMDSKTLMKYRKSLTELGLISWKQTSGYTVYWLLQPIQEISNFVFTDKEHEVIKVQAPQVFL